LLPAPLPCLRRVFSPPRQPPRPPLFPYTTLFRSTPFAPGLAQDEIYDHYRELREAVPIPLFIYNEEALSGNQIALDTLLRICRLDRKSTRLNSSHVKISYAVFCLKKKRRKQACIR